MWLKTFLLLHVLDFEYVKVSLLNCDEIKPKSSVYDMDISFPDSLLKVILLDKFWIERSCK